jgi:hypothetical protein
MSEGSMPFAVFRRHQRKMLAVLAILAMIGFVLGDAITYTFRGRNGGGADPVVVELYGRPVRRGAIEAMKAQRGRANLFVEQVLRINGLPPVTDQLFGDLSTRSIVDALILEHEADALGLPASPALAKAWLAEILPLIVERELLGPSVSPELVKPWLQRMLPNGLLDAERFDRIYRDVFRTQVTDVQLLTDLANQIRLLQARELPGPPPVTPLDIFRAYRDQAERVSIQAVALPVADFLGQVRAPTVAEVRAFYDRYKDRLPGPDDPIPGFRIPRRVQVESLALDGAALERRLRAALTEPVLRAAYERRKSAEFTLEPLARLPEDLFAGDPKATLTPPRKGVVPPPDPPRYQPFEDVRQILEDDLVAERVQEEVERLFEPIRQAMQDYADTYYQYLDAQEREEETRRPPPPDLKALAGKTGPLSYERTPPLSREQAEALAPISRSRVGWAQPSGERTFAEAIFEPRALLFEPIELSAPDGRRHLAWRVADEPSRVPDLPEVRDAVVAAWKLEQARPLAQKAAEELARKARAPGGDLPKAAGGRPVIVTALRSKLQPNPILDQARFGPPRPGDIPEIPQAGDALREAIFGVQPNEKEKGVAVAPNAPRTAYYVVAAHDRIPARFEALFAPSGPRTRFQAETLDEARSRRASDWLALLRTRAKLNPDWVPPDEEKDAG